MNGIKYEVPHCEVFTTSHYHLFWAKLFAPELSSQYSKNKLLKVRDHATKHILDWIQSLNILIIINVQKWIHHQERILLFYQELENLIIKVSNEANGACANHIIAFSWLVMNRCKNLLNSCDFPHGSFEPVFLTCNVKKCD